MTLTITTSEGTVTGILKGRLDTAASQQFATDMEALLDNADKHIVLDANHPMAGKDLTFALEIVSID